MTLLDMQFSPNNTLFLLYQMVQRQDVTRWQDVVNGHVILSESRNLRTRFHINHTKQGQQIYYLLVKMG